jgi:predicted MFS family arabinose efflux permease
VTVVQSVGVWLDATAVLHKPSQAWMWIVLGLVSAAGSATLARLADRVGKRWLVLVTTAVVAACLVALGQVGSLLGLCVVGIPLAACAAARSSAMMALATHVVPAEQRGTLMALRAASVNLGVAAIAKVGGEVHAASDYPSLLWFTAGAVAVSFVLVLLFVHEGQ